MNYTFYRINKVDKLSLSSYKCLTWYWNTRREVWFWPGHLIVIIAWPDSDASIYSWVPEDIFPSSLFLYPQGLLHKGSTRYFKSGPWHQGHVCLFHLTENGVNSFSKGKFCQFRNMALCQKYQNSNFPNNSERCLPGHFTYCYLRYTVKKRVPGPGGGRLCVGKLFILCGWWRTWWKLSNCRALCKYESASKMSSPPPPPPPHPPPP